MGSHSGTTEPDGFYPNGLLPDEAASVTRELHPKRWAKAEEHTAKLISRIQPNWPAEKHRNAVASYVQRLITECIMCQVFTFGSVPLKTYLPDGDIDLTAFSLNPSLKDTWAIKVRDMLQREEKNEQAEFRVKEVQYIQAEVKIIKCLVDNIVVDISFNQLGGLCTLCFLEEVDTLINQDHLFKRSIILIKAWCYYESRILGAHHGLISTYALETLVLYIFHVFNSSFTGPLEVLYRFLEFFSKFDWENFCVSLWGPVPISSLPDVTAEPPCRDGGDLLLSQMFLDACSAAFAVVPGGHENQEQPFIPKHFNIVDPLRTNNNLGRSVNKGNFFRIRSAFAFGAQRLARLLECPEVSIVAELNQFFMNTWERHGKGLRPDASIADVSQSIIEDSEHVDNLQNYGSSKKDTENSGGHDFRVEQVSTSQFSRVQHGNLPINQITKTLNESDVGPLFAKTDTNVSIKSSNQDQQNIQRSITDHEPQNDTGRTGRMRILQNEVPVTPQFARTYSSPELRNTSSEVMSQGRRNVVVDRMNDETTSSEYTRANWGSGVVDNRNGNLSTNEPLKGLVSANDSNCSTECSVDQSVSGAHSMGMHTHEEDKDFVDASSSSTPHNFVGQVQMPMNFASQLPVPIPASFWDYAYHNSLGRIPSDLPFFGPRWDSNMYHPHVPFPLPVSQNFSGNGRGSDHEETTGRFSGDLASREVNQHGGVWTDSECLRELDDEGARFQAQDMERRQHSTSTASDLITSVQMSNSEHHGQRIQDVGTKEKRELNRGNYTDGYRYKNDRASGEFSTASSRFSSPSIATSRTKGSSESSWDGSPSKTMPTAKARFVRKSPSSVDTVPVDSDGCQYEELIDHERGEVEGSSDHMSLPTADTVPVDSSVSSSRVEIHQLPGSHLAYPNLMLPITQMPVNVGSQHRMTHNHAVLPIAFYPAGPPVPFVTMLPFYNIPSESGTSSDSTNHFDAGDDVSSLLVSKSDRTEGLIRNLNYPGNSDNGGAVNEISSLEHSEERKSDILNSDIVSHRQNLQYGRLCQNSQSQSPLVCPPTVVPPLYLQGHYTSDSPGRLLPMNAVLYNHLMNLDPRLMSVPSPQLGSSHPAGVYQHYGGEIPRSRAGTGTYLPNPVFKDRNYSSSRHHRGNYNFDRKEHNGERETNWNANSRPRLSGRGQGRYQPDKANMRMERPPGRSSQPDRPWNQMRQYPYVPSHSTSGPSSGSRPTRYSHGNADYPMYPVPSRYDEGVSPPGDAPVVMFYPYDQTMDYGSSLGQQVRSGSVESLHSFNRDEVTEPCEYPGGAAKLPSYEGDSVGSSPDQPCSPNFMRGA